MSAETIIFLSRSTTPAALLSSQFSTSSQSYEVGLLRTLAIRADISIEYLGTASWGAKGIPAPRQRFDLGSLGVEINDRGPLSLLKVLGLIWYLRRRFEPEKVCIMTTGYYPLEMFMLRVLRCLGFRVYSIVYDTHVTATALMRQPKRFLADLYFETGFLLMRGLTGLMVLNDTFIRTKRIKAPYHQTLIGNIFSLPAQDAVKVARPPDRPLRLVFAGTMNRDNGVNLILDFLAATPTGDFTIDFYGEGDLLGLLQRRQVKDPRVCYQGLVSDVELDKRLAAADYLLCLRDPDSLVCEYSFPSKLIKFMGSGVPVIANAFPGLDAGYLPGLILMDSFTTESLGRVIADAVAGRIDPAKAQLARAYLEEHNRWDNIVGAMLVFMAQPAR